MTFQNSKMLSFHDDNDKDTGFAVALGIQHYLGSPVPSCGNVFREEAGVVVVWISNPCQAEVTYLSPYNCNHFYILNVSIDRSDRSRNMPAKTKLRVHIHCKQLLLIYNDRYLKLLIR